MRLVRPSRLRTQRPFLRLRLHLRRLLRVEMRIFFGGAGRIAP